jgi:hypothetical protein
VVQVPAGAAGSLRGADALEIAEAAWFPLDRLPDGLSPATRRRLDEFRSGAVADGDW